MTAAVPVFDARIHDPYRIYPTAPYVAHRYELIEDDSTARPVVQWLGRFNGENRVRVVSLLPDGTVVEPGPVRHRYGGATLFHGAASPFEDVRTSPIMTMDPLTLTTNDSNGEPNG